MKILLLIIAFMVTNNIYSSEFENFVRLINEKDDQTLMILDHHASKIGPNNFKNQYLTEISKELFSMELFSTNNKYIVSKKTYPSEKKSILKKVNPKHQYLVKQLCEDIESFIHGNQYSSLEKFNNYPTARITKVIRANLKKVRLISKIWLFLEKSSAEKIKNTLNEIIENAQKRALLLASLSSKVPADYKVVFFKPPTPKQVLLPEKEITEQTESTKAIKVKTLEEIVRDEKTIKKADIKNQKDKKKEWKPKEEPSYTGLLNMFLNTSRQTQAKQAKYIAPKTLPKPSNDW